MRTVAGDPLWARRPVALTTEDKGLGFDELGQKPKSRYTQIRVNNSLSSLGCSAYRACWRELYVSLLSQHNEVSANVDKRQEYTLIRADAQTQRNSKFRLERAIFSAIHMRLV